MELLEERNAHLQRKMEVSQSDGATAVFPEILEIILFLEGCHSSGNMTIKPYVTLCNFHMQFFNVYNM